MTYILMRPVSTLPPTSMSFSPRILFRSQPLPTRCVRDLQTYDQTPIEEDVDVKELRTCCRRDSMPNHLLLTDLQGFGNNMNVMDCPLCVEEHGSVVRHVASTSTSLHTLHLDTGYWGELSLDGTRCFVAAGLRVRKRSCSFRSSSP